MTNVPAASSGDVGADATRSDMQDDASDITSPGGSGSGGNQRMSTEKGEVPICYRKPKPQ
jgi:hypothetical protein